LKYAVISDVHANLEAVTACFEEIERLKANRIICLGDLVDYCAEPNEVITLIRQKCDIIILGNHDEAQYNWQLSERFNERARISSVHTRGVLEPAHLEFIKSLRLTHSENDLLFVHASPYEPQNYKYVRDTEAAELNFAAFTEKICFIGHSHRPVIFSLTGGKASETFPGKLDTERKYIINVGSVGQPRDDNPMLSFGFFDTDAYTYQNIRIPYDNLTASKKIENEGLPEFLSQRILEGK
jgi:predicted phosphodiesterase